MNARASAASRLQKIREIARLINAGGDLNAILQQIVYAICRHSDWASCGVMRIDAKTGYSVLVQRFDPHTSAAKKSANRWALASSPAAVVAASGEALVIPDAQRAAEYPGYKKDARLRDYHTVVILPLGARDNRGREMILAVQSRQVVKVSKPELAFLKTASDLAAIAVEKTLRLQHARAANAKLRKTTAMHARLMAQILSNVSLAAVCEMLEKSMRHSWLVIDLTTRMIYAGGNAPVANLSDTQWREALRGAAGRGFFAAARAARRSQFKQPVDLEFNAGDKPVALRAFIEPLLVDGETMGALLLAPGKSAFDEFDRLTAETVLLALSVQLMRETIHFQTEATSRLDVLARLFSGDWRSTEGFAARARDLGIDTSAPVKLTGFTFLDGAGAPAIDHAHRCIGELVGKCFAGAVTVNHGGDIIALLPAAQERDDWHELTQRLLDDAKWRLGARPVLFCGRVCARPEDYAPAGRECARMLKLARLFKRDGLVSENDFDSTAVLLSVAENRAARAFVGRQLIPIRDYDNAHGTKYLATLKAFAESEGRFESCAKTLGIHVSTLRYRLQRIADRFGVATMDAEARFDILLAVKLHDLARMNPSE